MSISDFFKKLLSGGQTDLEQPEDLTAESNADSDKTRETFWDNAKSLADSQKNPKRSKDTTDEPNADSDKRRESFWDNAKGLAQGSTPSETIDSYQPAGGLSADDSINETASRQPTRRDKILFIIGLDFGTAFTKVVISEVRKKYAVPFSQVKGIDNPFLLPCIMSIDGRGICFLGEKTDAVRQINNLKMRLLDRDHDDSYKFEIAAFLGLVLRHSKDWLLTEHDTIYRNIYPDWYINVGLPTNDYEDDELKKLYGDITCTAWEASCLSDPISLQLIKNIYSARKPNQIPGIGQDKIALFPEFISQLTGYVRSPQRQLDLHGLIDVGAGTVDMTVFNIWEKEGEDEYHIFTKLVEPIGVNYFFHQRIERLNSDKSIDLRPGIIPPTTEEAAGLLEIDHKKLDEIDGLILQDIRMKFLTQLRYAQENRYPDSPRWAEGVPLFVCGGGSRLDVYKELFASLARQNRYRIVLQNLPAPAELEAEGLGQEDFDRLSVAYGLSFDALNIGAIIKSNQIENINPGLRQSEGVCERCNGEGGALHGCPICGGTGWISPWG